MMIPACDVVERAAAVEPFRFVGCRSGGFCFVVDIRCVDIRWVDIRWGAAHLEDVALFVATDAFPFALPGFVTDPEALAAEEEGVDPLADFGREAEEGLVGVLDHAVGGDLVSD